MLLVCCNITLARHAVQLILPFCYPCACCKLNSIGEMLGLKVLEVNDDAVVAVAGPTDPGRDGGVDGAGGFF
jgi:hypothetical protein